MEGHAAQIQAFIDGLEGFKRAHVDGVHGGTHQDDVLQVRLFCDFVIDAILKGACVRKVQAFINPNGQNALVNDHLVAQNIPVMFSARHLTNDSHVWPRCFEQVDKDRNRNAGCDA